MCSLSSKCRVALIAPILLLLPRVNPAKSQTLIPPDKGPIPLTYFDLNLHGVAPTQTMPVSFYSLRISQRIFAWRQLEPKKGDWDFKGTDYAVKQAERLGVQLLVVLQSIPDWDCETGPAVEDETTPSGGFCGITKSDDDWVNYVRTVATRYKGRIHAYELWNEPYMVPSFRQSPRQLAHLNELAYQTLKSVDPTVVVASSALSTGDPRPGEQARQLAEFSAAGALLGDVIAYHFYEVPREGSSTQGIPEEIIPRMQLVESIAHGKPIWNTEVGWKILNEDYNPPNPAFMGTPLSPALGAAYLSRSYILGWALGISRVYWYAWQDGHYGMTNFDGSSKAPVEAFAQTENWLLGSNMNQCSRARDGMWSCGIVLAGGTPATIVWLERGEKQYPLNSVPGAAQATKLQHLNGDEIPIGNNIIVNTMPELLE